MAREIKEESQLKETEQDFSTTRYSRRVEESETPKSLSTIEAIQLIAAANARADLSDDNQLLLFLMSWWSKTYNRPLKDPILLSYTVEELLYEFYDRLERKNAEEERSKQESDKIEEDKEKEALDWAEQEEKKELEKEGKVSSPSDPTKDPDNIKWMQEQLEKAKQAYGESFGEDIEETFE
jgi:hypothetical protein